MGLLLVDERSAPREVEPQPLALSNRRRLNLSNHVDFHCHVFG